MSLINIKFGYNVDDKLEFKVVRNYIVNNGYSPRLFDHHLESLVIDKEMNKKVTSKFVDYDPVMNKINGTSKGYRLVHELFHMASNNDENINVGVRNGFDFGNSLNEGITDFLTQSVCLDYDVRYIYEVLFLEAISYMYPSTIKERMKCYFEGESAKYFDAFGEDRKIVVDAVSELDLFTKKKSHNSRSLVTGEELYPIDEITDHLTNAFSIIINRAKELNEEAAEELLEDFEYTTFEKNVFKDPEKLFKQLLSKINKEKKYGIKE